MKLAYWKKYDRLFKKFSAKSIYNLIFSFVKQAGSPYYRKNNLGRGEKLTPIEYAAFIIFMMITRGATYRQMEMESEVYTGKHIDHSTLALNFEKIPVLYYMDLVEETGAFLDKLLEHSDQYAVDSTAITTPLKFSTKINGKKVEERIEFRGHIIASLHSKDNCVCIKRTIPTTKNIADCEGAKMMLKGWNIPGITLHADRGYDYERVYEACDESKIIPNIKPQEYKLTEETYRWKGIMEYDNKKRKAMRGIIETVFGGLTNAGLLITRLKKRIRIVAYTAIVMLRHNILNIAKNGT